MSTRSVLMLTLSCLALTAVLIATGPTPDPQAAPADAKRDRGVTLTLGQTLDLDVRSDTIEWRDKPLELLAFAKATFSRGDDGRLQAKLTGRAITFDDVDYTLHAAVYSPDGELLGTASTACPVQRVWLGGVLTTFLEDVELDFGLSNAYQHAARVEFAITTHDVLTPEQWQKDD